MDREDGLVRERPAVLVLRHLHEVWRDNEPFMPTSALIDALVTTHPSDWGQGSSFGKALTAQRLGKMLAQSYGINSGRLDRIGPRGYIYASLLPVWRRMGVVRDARRSAPVRVAPSKQTGASGSPGSTGAACTACGGPMVMVEPGQTTHPTCTPRRAA